MAATARRTRALALLLAALPVTVHAVDFGGLFGNDTDTVTADGSYTLSSGQLQSRVQIIGNSGSGVLQQTGGSNTVTEVLTLGRLAGSNGFYNVNGGSLSAAQVLVGEQGSGTLRLSAGSIRVSGLTRVVGGSELSIVSGTFNALGGVQFSGGLVDVFNGVLLGAVEMNGAASFSQWGGARAGSLTMRSGHFVFWGGAATGKLSLYGGEFQLRGGAMTGDVLVDGGYLTVITDSVVDGRLTTRSRDPLRLFGTVTFANGLRNEGDLGLATGRVTVNGAGLTNTGSLWLERTLDGSGAMVNSGRIDVAATGRIGGTGGFTNSGTLALTTGSRPGAAIESVFRPATLVLANTGTNANTGTLRLPGSTTLTLEGAGVRLFNRGSIELSGGTVNGSGRLSNQAGGVIEGSGTIAALLDNEGRITARGGELNFGQTLLNRGELEVAASAYFAGATIDNRVGLTVHGTVDNAIVNTGQVQVARQAAAFVNGDFTNARGGVLRIGGEPTGSGVLQRGWFSGRVENADGARIEVVGDGDARFMGELLLRQGSTLALNGERGGTFRDRVLFERGVTLEGPGRLNFGNGGRFEFGDARTRVVHAGPVFFNDGSTFMAELLGDANGARASLLSVGGLLGLGDASLVLHGSGTLRFNAGDRFDLLDWQTLAGQFARFDAGGAPLRDGLAWSLADLYVNGQIAVVAVPEPDTGLLLAFGVMGLMAFARRRRLVARV